PGHRGGRSRTDAQRFGHKRYEAELRAAVTFSKRMNSIELREEKRRAGTEVECGSSLQIALRLQTSEDALQFARDVLGIAKGAGTFGKAHFAISAGPIMDVFGRGGGALRGFESSTERLLGTGEGHRCFIFVERLWRGQPRLVPEYCASGPKTMLWPTEMWAINIT